MLIVPARAAGSISIDVSDADLSSVLSMLAQDASVNLVADASLKPERVSLHLHGVSFDEALNVLVEAHGLQVRREGNVLIVGSALAMNRRYADRTDPLGAQTAVLALRYGDPDEVVKELTGGLPEDTVLVADKRTESVIVTGNATTVARARQLVSALDAPASPAGASATRAYPLRYTRPTILAASLKGVLPDGSYVADDGQNAIVVTGSPRVQRTASGLIAALDAASPQVLFEVRVIDAEPLNEQSDVGFEFGGYDLAGAPIAGAATYAFARNSLAINARLNAMVSQGHAQILATPRLLTINNKEADLLIGQTYPVVSYDSALGIQQVQFVDVGVKLRLTPTIGSNGSVTAEMHPEYSEIIGFSGGYPVVANRKLDSTLRVASDQTIVLGGLIRETRSESVTKVPGLGDIPILGKLFQNRQRTHQRDEVIFLITPHVILPNQAPPAH